jgi:hypothetical protein
MLRRWGPALQHDPAYNPNLTLELNDFSLASPPRPPATLRRESPSNGHAAHALSASDAAALDRLGTPGSMNGSS